MRATLYTARWVLPVSAAPLPDGAVLVDERGVIAEVAPRTAVSVGDDVAVHDLGEALLLPGLVNVHAHPELAMLRGALEDLPFHEWIPALQRVKRAAALTAADYAAAARWTLAESLAAGVTTVGATEESAASLDALRESGVRGVVYCEVFGPAPADARGALIRLHERIDGLRQRATDRVRVGVSPHAPYTVSDELFALTASFAAAESLPLAVHIAESEVESQLVEHGAGPFAAGLRTRGIATPPRAATPVTLLERTGVLAARPLLIHCVRVSAADADRIAAHGASVAHCPVANARLGHGIAPVIELLERGIVVALGSDSVAANNRIDLIDEARIAQLMQRARARSAGALPPHQLLRMLTLDGARALGCADRTGSLEPGKDADLCAVAIAAPHTRPVAEPHAALILAAGAADVILTVVQGNVLYERGRHSTLDVERLRPQLDEIGRRVAAARTQRTA